MPSTTTTTTATEPLLLCEQTLTLTLNNPTQIAWGNSQALRFDVFIKDKETNRVFIKIPGFVVRNQSLLVPQRKTRNGYGEAINVRESLLTAIQSLLWDGWKELYPEVNFPEKEISEE